MLICSMCGGEFDEDEMVGDFCINCSSILSDEEKYF